MRVTVLGIQPWTNGYPCEEVGCESTSYADCMNCRLNDVPAALEIRLKLWPADGSAEQVDFLKRLHSAVANLNGKPEKVIQMSLFERK